VKPVHAALAATTALAVLAAGAGSALAAPAGVPVGVRALFAAPALGNPGAASPSLSLSVAAAGDPEIATIGGHNSLQYYTKVKGKWTRKQLAGANSAFAGASLISGPVSDAAIAVQGPGHSLVLYIKTSGHWRKENVAGPDTTYSAPSLALGKSAIAIAILGKSHSLWYYWFDTSWHKHAILGGERAFSAPSLVLRASGAADIAVEGANHTLSYLSAANPLHWANDVIGAVGTTYSAPSLAFGAGEPVIAVEGPHHQLLAFSKGGRWKSSKLEPSGRCYSAPSLRENVSDATRPVEIAFQGASHSVTLLFFDAGIPTAGWVNDVITQATGSVDSAPALFDRGANPAGEADLVFQGKGDTLWYYHAPKPSIAGLAPSFTGLRIGGPGSTFGG
jgi:hypothetical protein